MSHKFSECNTIHMHEDCFYCRYQERHIEEAPCYSCLFGKECEFESTDIV